MVRLARVGVAAFSMYHPQVIRSHQLTRHNGGNTLKSQGNRKGLRAPPLNWVECGKFELKSLGALDQRNDSMVASPGCYSAANFTGAASYAVHSIEYMLYRE